ncbi:hypothetical protein [Polymorphospora sp. NPDC050346]|uniref:hypothetical protein n=1 Tax=Polymorphospora sp. NPDC050346 TaxID=3155780 RepID=UPI003400A48D
MTTHIDSTDKGRHGMQENRRILYVAIGVFFSVLALAAFVVLQLDSADPAATATVVMALAALLGTIAPIILALRGR